MEMPDRTYTFTPTDEYGALLDLGQSDFGLSRLGTLNVCEEQYDKSYVNPPDSDTLPETAMWFIRGSAIHCSFSHYWLRITGGFNYHSPDEAWAVWLAENHGDHSKALGIAIGHYPRPVCWIRGQVCAIPDNLVHVFEGGNINSAVFINGRTISYPVGSTRTKAFSRLRSIPLGRDIDTAHQAD